MSKTTKKDLENKAILNPCKTRKNQSDTNILDKTKKCGKRLKKGLSGIDPVSKSISFDHLIRCSSIVLSLMLHYRLNNRVDVYVILVLISHPDPLSLSALTRLAGVSNASYVAESLRRLIDLDVVNKSVCSSPLYCLSISCKDQLLQLIDEV